jgi:hypothetical protein
MSFRVIGMCGYSSAGKDTAAQCLVDRGYERVALADPVREALLALAPYVYVVAKNGVGHWKRLSEIVHNYGWDAAKQLTEVRRLLQRMGTEAGREIHGEGCWVDIADDTIRRAQREGKPGAVITDIRFRNEAELVQEWRWRLDFEGSGSATLLYIERPGVGPVNEHTSEDLTAAKAMADAKILNDGSVPQLHQRVLAACGIEEAATV